MLESYHTWLNFLFLRHTKCRASLRGGRRFGEGTRSRQCGCSWNWGFILWLNTFSVKTYMVFALNNGAPFYISDRLSSSKRPKSLLSSLSSFLSPKSPHFTHWSLYPLLPPYSTAPTSPETFRVTFLKSPWHPRRYHEYSPVWTSWVWLITSCAWPP